MKQLILTVLVSLTMLAAHAQEQGGQQADKEKKASSIVQNDEDLTIYPNPSNGVFTVSLANSNAKRAEVRIMNVIGNEIYHETLTRENALISTTIDLSRYSKSKGLYYVKIEADNYSVVRRVIVK